MSTVLLREPLLPEELKLIKQEVPRYDFYVHETHAPVPPEIWERVEVIFGARLSVEELSLAPRLRWIHVPIADTHGLCMHQIAESTNVLVTITKSTDVHQVGEFVLSVILAFSKHLFEWERLQATPQQLKESPLRTGVVSLRHRQLLQIGLGITGTAVTEICRRVGMRAWGLQDPPSYHPYSDKVYPSHELNALLPAADVVCVALPQGQHAPCIIGRGQLELMKQDSILIVLRSEGAVDEEALATLAPTGKFRGIAFDSLPRDLGSKPSPLWTAPNVLLTPHVGPLPEPPERISFSLLRYNFRRYLREDFERLRYRITEPAPPSKAHP